MHYNFFYFCVWGIMIVGIYGDSDSEREWNSFRFAAIKLKCVPVPILREDFNDQAQLPYGLTSEHVYRAMNDFLQFLGFINQQRNEQGMDRLESILMPASEVAWLGSLWFRRFRAIVQA